MLATDLFAKANSSKNHGQHECHWCGAACTDYHTANFIPRQMQPIGQKLSPLEKRPSSPYECWGCWLYHRKRVTIDFFAGGYQDGQCPENHSWYLTASGCWALRPQDSNELYSNLLKPPLCFSLSLLSNGPISSGILPHNGTKNHLQLAIVNEHVEIKNNTPLDFTINNIPHRYTIFDLENEGAEPGTQALLRVLGPIPESLKPKKHSQNDGRPTLIPKNMPGRVTVCTSGSAA